jgi:hypothetical protein
MLLKPQPSKTEGISDAVVESQTHFAGVAFEILPIQFGCRVFFGGFAERQQHRPGQKT